MIRFLYIIRGYISSVLELIYPRLCCACREELAAGERIICTNCRWELSMTYNWRMDNNYSVDVLSGKFEMVHATSFLFYEQSHLSRNLVHQIKYNGRDDLAYELGAMYGRVLCESGRYNDVDVIVPVPLHWSKRIKRGYNQSEVIAKAMAKVMMVDYGPSIIKRKRRTKTQALKKNRMERWNNVSGAFSVSSYKSMDLNTKHVILVDDVLTTGATIESCACELQRSYPGVRISVATLALAKRGDSTKY